MLFFQGHRWRTKDSPPSEADGGPSLGLPMNSDLKLPKASAQHSSLHHWGTAQQNLLGFFFSVHFLLNFSIHTQVFQQEVRYIRKSHINTGIRQVLLVVGARR